MKHFYWDSDKELQNKLKHGVDFETASLAFADPHVHIIIDEIHSAKEIRYFCLGRVNGKVLTVRFTYRQNGIRIIGAGYWRKGRDFYEKKEKRN